MISLIIQYFRRNSDVMLVAFEVFWIIVFLLDRVTTGGGSGVPDFVYVNF